MMVIVVTGAGGHVGNVVVRELLAQGKSVRAQLLPGEGAEALEGLDVEILRGNVLDRAFLGSTFAGADAVFHVAGMVYISPGQDEMIQRVNVEGTRNVLCAAEACRVRRLVYTSSIHAFVEPPAGDTIDEACGFDPARSRGSYDRSKAQASLEALAAAARGMDVVVVAPTGVIGPYDFRGSIMGGVLNSLKADKYWGLPDGAYDFVDVRDVAAGHVAALERGRAGEAYILSGECIRIADLARLIDQVLGRPQRTHLTIPEWLARAAGFVGTRLIPSLGASTRMTEYSIATLFSNACISSDKARRELGFSPRPIADSIRDSLAWQGMGAAGFVAAARDWPR